MLGELIEESKGKRTGRKVLPAEGPALKVEVSFEAAAKLLGIESNGIGTYVSGTRPDGSLYGEGQGIIVSNEGDAATWKGAGVGRFTGAGAVAYRGAIYYQSASPKFARLNGVA